MASAVAVVSPTTLNATEASETRTYTVTLDSAPVSDVVITPREVVPQGQVSAVIVTTPALAAQAPNDNKLTFATAGPSLLDYWDIPRTVTVVTRNNDIDDGSQRTVMITNTTTIGPNQNAPNVTVNVANNDTRGVTLDPSADVILSETGIKTYSLVLTSEPTADVIITPTSDDTNTARLTTANGNDKLTFTAGNWRVAQTVTVTSVNDNIQNFNGNRAAMISHTLTGGDYGTNSVIVDDISAIVVDDDFIRSESVIVSEDTVTMAEADGQATYTVKLANLPSADVIFTFGFVANTFQYPLPVVTTVNADGKLTFTFSNWNTLQTVTVTGVDDDFDNPGDQREATITHTLTGGGYIGTMGPTVSAISTDDDTRGVRQLDVSGGRVIVSEDGTTNIFTYRLKLTSQPIATDVPISFTASAGAVVTTANGDNKLTFEWDNKSAPEGWDYPQTVTVVGVPDAIDNAGNQRSATITHMVDDSSIPYANINLTGIDLDVTVTDDDTRSVIVSESTVTMVEAGGTETYTLVLTSEPNGGNVIITPTSSTPGNATVTTANGDGKLTFTTTGAGIWSDAQTVIVTGVDDNFDNPNDQRSATISHAVSAAGTDYATGVLVDPVIVTVTDGETRGVTVSGTSLTVSENSGIGTYSLVLNSEPTADMTIAPTSDATSNATVSLAGGGLVLTFTPANWQNPQMVTVTGVDDDIRNASSRTASIIHTVYGGDYTNATPEVIVDDVSVIVSDDDMLGVTMDTNNFELREDGEQATYNLNLNSMPTAQVIITLTPGEGVIVSTVNADGNLTFTTGNWDAEQTVNVTGALNDIDHGNSRIVTISYSTSSEDSDYDDISLVNASITVIDNDTRGVTVIAPGAGVEVEEDGGTETYTLVLTSEPNGGNVIITPTSSTPDNATVSTVSAANDNNLTFTADNWEDEQTVTVRGVNDNNINNTNNDYRIATISHSVSGGDYTNATPAVTVDPVAVTITDNDTRTVTTSKNSVIVSEDGTINETYTLVLDSKPLDDVVLQVASDDPTTAQVNAVDSVLLTFTPTNWDDFQTVSVTGVNETGSNPNVGGSRSATINHTVNNVTSYASLSTRFSAVSVLVIDDNTRNVTMSKTSLTVSESGTAETYTLVLNIVQPLSNVIINPISNNTSVAKVTTVNADGKLTFTPDNYDILQTVTVTGANDNIDNGPNSSVIVTNNVVSTDTNFSSGADPVRVTVLNQNVVGVTQSVDNLSVTEAGGGVATLSPTP